MLTSRALRFGAPLATSALVLTTWSVAATAMAGSARPTCAGHTATIVNRHDHATVRGTSGNDVIVTLGADPTVRAGDGDDVVCLLNGGWAHGGAGDDVLFGSPSYDFLYGEDGNDVLRGGAGDDTLSGGAGDDRVFGGTSDQGDRFMADSGDDLWVMDRVLGRPEQESTPWPRTRLDFSAATSGVHVDLHGRIAGGVGHGTAEGEAIGHDRLRFPADRPRFRTPKVIGTSFDDKLIGSRGRDDIDGYLGADVIWGLGENDHIGQTGNSQRTAPVAPGITFMWGGPGNDDINAQGDTRQSVLHGGSGNDSIGANQESEHVTGDDGNDYISADFSPGQDVVMDAGSGTDQVTLWLQPAEGKGDFGTFTVDLAAGTATASTSAPRPLTGAENLTVIPLDRFPDLHVASIVVRGTDGPNRLGASFFAAVPSFIYGLGGDDTLLGGDADDTLDGGAGNDTGDGGLGHNTCTSVETATNCSG